MTLADAYRRLGEILSGLEAGGIEVSDVVPAQDESGDALQVDLRIEIPMAADAPEPAIGGTTNRAGAVADGAGVAATGGTGAATDAAAEPASDEGADSVDEAGTDGGDEATPGASQTDAGMDSGDEGRSGAAYPCGAPDCGAGFDSEAALSVHRFVDHETLDEPIHKHEPALRASYDAYDSFASMTDALGADVTPQTVRRNMMKFGIHEPETASDGPEDEAPEDDASESDTASADRDDEGAADSVDTSADPADADSSHDADAGEATATEDGESAAEERTVTDGSGAVATGSTGSDTDAAPEEARLEALPADIAVSDLRAAVVEGGSLRAAARRLDRSRGATRDLLQSNDLLELVHGRVATRPEREERAAAFEDWLDAQREDDVRRL